MSTSSQLVVLLCFSYHLESITLRALLQNVLRGSCCRQRVPYFQAQVRVNMRPVGLSCRELLCGVKPTQPDFRCFASKEVPWAVAAEKPTRRWSKTSEGSRICVGSAEEVHSYAPRITSQVRYLCTTLPGLMSAEQAAKQKQGLGCKLHQARSHLWNLWDPGLSD